MNWQFFELLRQHRHSGAYRSVGLALAIRAKKDEPICWPSITTLCRDASVCRLTVTRAVKHFESQGLLTIEKRVGQVNRYHLCSRPPAAYQSVTETGYRATSETGWPPRASRPLRRDPTTTETRNKTNNCTPEQGGHAGLDKTDIPY